MDAETDRRTANLLVRQMALPKALRFGDNGCGGGPMGSLIPSEMWDWRKDWPKAAAGVAITLLLFAILVAVTVIW